MEDFILFFASVLSIDPSLVDENTTYGQCPKWDSMMHLRLVMEIEEKYDVEIPIDDVPKIKTVKDFYDYIVKSK